MLRSPRPGLLAVRGRAERPAPGRSPTLEVRPVVVGDHVVPTRRGGGSSRRLPPSSTGTRRGHLRIRGSSRHVAVGARSATSARAAALTSTARDSAAADVGSAHAVDARAATSITATTRITPHRGRRRGGSWLGREGRGECTGDHGPASLGTGFERILDAVRATAHTICPHGRRGDWDPAGRAAGARTDAGGRVRGRLGAAGGRGGLREDDGAGGGDRALGPARRVGGLRRHRRRSRAAAGRRGRRAARGGPRPRGRGRRQARDRRSSRSTSGRPPPRCSPSWSACWSSR